MLSFELLDASGIWATIAYTGIAEKTELKGKLIINKGKAEKFTYGS
jgi:hypothetical protein